MNEYFRRDLSIVVYCIDQEVDYSRLVQISLREVPITHAGSKVYPHYEVKMCGCLQGWNDHKITRLGNSSHFHNRQR